MTSTDILMVADIAQILRISQNTIHSRRWQEKSRCPLYKKGKRLYAIATEFWRWFRSDSTK